MATRKKPSGLNPALLAYIVVFGVLIAIYGKKALEGTATSFEWITLVGAVLLLLVAVFRLLRDLGRPQA